MTTEDRLIMRVSLRLGIRRLKMQAQTRRERLGIYFVNHFSLSLGCIDILGVSGKLEKINIEIKRGIGRSSNWATRS